VLPILVFLLTLVSLLLHHRFTLEQTVQSPVRLGAVLRVHFRSGGFLRYFIFFVLLCSFTVEHAGLNAQEANGRVIGTITDPQGAAIAGVKITVIESDTQVSRTTTTQSDGSYQVLELPIGNYSVVAEQPGFSKVLTAPQKLLINQSLRIDIPLQLGQVSHTIQVEAAASNIETVVAQLGSSVTQKTIQNLPLNGRNTLDLALLQPGVVAANPLANAGTPSNNTAQSFNVAGGRSDSVTFLLDGGINNNLLSNGIVFQPNPDAVAEFHILTSNYGAEYGRNGGGIVSEVIKSGTNSIHGSAYDYLRNQDFNANLYFNNANHVPVPVLKRNQFGVSFGSPIVIPKLINGRDKLFFFISYQGQRQVSTTVNSAITVYTPSELNGDFSHSNASKTGPDQNVVRYLQAHPYYQANAALAAQGILDPVRIDPVAQNYIKAGLIPNSATGQIIPFGNAQSNSDDLIEKIDYAPAEKDRIFVTLNSGRAPSLNPFAVASSVPGYPTTTTTRRYHGVVDETHIFTPNIINDLRFTAQRNNILQAVPAGKLPISTALGINIISDNPTGPTFLSFASGAMVGYSVQGPTSLIDNTYDLSDVFTWTHERHTFKYGFTVEPYQDNTNYDFVVNGEFFLRGFSGVGSLNDRADFLFGLPDEYQQFGAAPSNIRSKYWAGFGQDEWRVLPNLTLTLGLRYEYSSPKFDTQGRSFSLKYGTQSTVFPGAPIGLLFPGDAAAPTGANFPDRNNFAPRFGFAYSPGEKKMSIRGGFGVFYDILKGEDNLQFNGQAPFYGYSDLGFNRLSGNPAGPVNYFSNPFVAAGQPNPFPSTPPSHNINFAQAGDLPIGGGGVYFVNPRIRTPYVYQYNLSIQRQIASSMVLEVNYVGSSSHKLTGLVDSNPFMLGTSTRLFGTQPGANPRYYSYLDTFDNVGRAHYNSLEAGFSKRLSGSLLGDTQFQLSYTYGHSIDNESGFRENTNRVPYYNQKQFTASSDYDIRHNLVFSGDWTLPFDKIWASGPSRLTKGWNLYPIVSYRTGYPLDIYAGISRSRLRIGPSGAGDPNLVRANLLTPNVPLFDPHNVQVLNGKTGTYYFNPADFGTFADINSNQNTYGTLGRNAIYGPGRVNTDISLVKSTALYSERAVLEFHADFFNIFNHAEFNNPNVTITNGTFGQITSTAPGRIIQLALHLTF